MHKSVNRLIVVALAVVAVASATSPAVAGHGFPNFRYHGIGYHGIGYHGSAWSSHYSYRVRSYGLARHGWHHPWHAHRWVGHPYAYSYVYAPRVHYQPAYYWTYPSVQFRHFNSYIGGWPGGWCYPAYSTSFYSTSYQASHLRTSPWNAPSYPVVHNTGALAANRPPLITGDRLAQSATTPGQFVALSGTSNRLVTPATAATVSDDLPEELLEAADRILSAGGYRQAATAYARLTERFGSSPRLLGRRFIAQVLSGDYDQAAVLAASSRLMEQPITRQYLPSGSLAGLGISLEESQAVTEQLAAFAVPRTTDAAALAAVAYWLHLHGDDDKSYLFFRRVDQLETADSVAVSPPADASRSTPRLVSLD